jgi:hypothetical protein
MRTINETTMKEKENLYSAKLVKNRDEVLKLLIPLFPESGTAGVYISRKLKAEMCVVGDEISIYFYKR